MKRATLIVAMVATAVSGCSAGTQTSDAEAAMREHADRMSLDRAVLEAINEPGGGDYARAVAITRASNTPQPTKNYEIGQLIIGSFDQTGSRRPSETLQQGLGLMEWAAVQPSEMPLYAPQQLRLMFERGVGKPPEGIPINKPVADCWHKLERNGPGDPARCVALRRERLPQLSE